MSQTTKTTTKKVSNNNEPKKRSKRFTIILVIILTLGIFGLLVMGHFLFKSCKPKHDGDFAVTVVQPTDEKYRLTVNDKTGTFYVNKDDELKVVVSPATEQANNYSCFDNLSTSNDVIYYAQVSSAKTKEVFAESPLSEKEGKYMTTFTMQWTFDIVIQVVQSEDTEKFIYTTNDQGKVEYVYDALTLCSASSPILRTKVGTFEQEQFDRDKFDDNLWIGKEISYLDRSFLSGCTNFNSPIHFQSDGKLQKISTHFLSNCVKFNQPLIFPDTLTQISGVFMNGCTTFNQEINTNKIVNLCDDNDNSSFMFRCTSFNSKVTIGSALENMPNYFLTGCTSFNQPITIPENINHVRDGFLRNCDAMTSTITVNCPVNAFTASENVCSTNNPYAACVGGMKIAGPQEQVDAWMSTFPDLNDTSQNIYRKLVRA